MTLEQIKTAKAAKGAEIRAKIAELDAAVGKPAVDKIVGEHDALIREWDHLAWREKAHEAADARDADLARTNQETITMHYGSAARVPGGERGARNAAMQAALLHRHDEARYQLPASALDFRGMSLLEMAAEVLTAEGNYRRGDGKSEVAARALQATSDFPNILANVANKVLLDGYAASPPTFKPLGRKITFKNFRPQSFVRLSDAPQLDEIKEDGEFKRGSMSDSGNTLAPKTYGKVVGITRNVIINDDVGAFTDVPALFGRSAANLESDLTWSMILSNPVMGDGQHAFSAAHGNIVAAGSGAPPAIATVSAGRAALAKMKNTSGTVLNVRPKFIVAPSDIEVQVAQLLYPIQATTSAAAVPEAIKSLTPITEPRLSLGARGQAGSSTGWYLFADPMAIDTFGYGYLEGQDGPYTETRAGFDVDGIEVKCRHDFGCGWLDFRGVYFNAGV